MLKKSLSVIFINLIFLISSIFFVPFDKTYTVKNVISPTKFELENQIFTFEDLDCFDSDFSEHNRELAKNLSLTEEEAFILGNLGKYWSEGLMKNRKINIKNKKDLVFYKHSYKIKFLYSGFCIKDNKPYYKEAFDRRLKSIRRTKYVILDLDTEKYYDVSVSNAMKIRNYIIIRRNHLPKTPVKNKYIKTKFIKDNIKIILSDSTTKIKPDKDCSSNVCREILDNINKAEKTIDIAIYGYSHTVAIEEAIKKAIQRGVKIRLICDSDSKGENIYPDTKFLKHLIPDNKDDFKSSNNQAIMHNKFYIFDNKKVITGSANLSGSDMSGFNTNAVLSLDSAEIAKIYSKEFEQMYQGKFHTDKISHNNEKVQINDTKFEIFFSPQDKSITNAVLPIIQNSKKYIYIPTFVLTEPQLVKELVNAKNRGVEVKIIMDALNASIRHSKHKELRNAGIPVKTENYAGKMHAKSIIVDDKYAIIGSMNFSNSGENKNDENLVLITDTDIAKFYKYFFLYLWERIDDRWLKNNVRAESVDSIGSCFDGIDNNYNDLIDSEDPACKSK